jgi:hypothetical protein
MRLTYSIKLEHLSNFRIKIEQINLFELKFNSSIILVKNIKNTKNSINLVKI